MKSFKQHITEQQTLLEKLMIIGKGKRFGQVVFMASGAGGGKGFVINNFMEGEKFKVIDVDALKVSILKLSKEKNKYPEVRDLNLKNPKDVFLLHKFVKDKGWKDTILNNLFTNASPDTLPNVIFDITLKEATDVTDKLPMLQMAGYDAKNMHIVWVLTAYDVAVKQNQNRDRVVPAEVLLDTHVGSAATMHDFISGNLPRGVDGEIFVVLGGPKNTVFFTDKDGKPIRTGKDKQTLTVKSFTYVKVKEAGKSLLPKDQLDQRIFQWIDDNAPPDKRISHIFSKDRKSSSEG